MRAVIKTHKAANQAEARRWLSDNGFVSVNGTWVDSMNWWARTQALPSGKILIEVGV